MLSLTRALAARQDKIRNNDKGFTLIELLVVVIIIGILAAIAIPIFLGQQDQAKDSAAKSDLASAKVIAVSLLVDSSAVPTTAEVQAEFTVTDGVTGFKVVDQTGTGSTAFCIEATSAAGNDFNVTDTAGITDGLCTVAL